MAILIGEAAVIFRMHDGEVHMAKGQLIQITLETVGLYHELGYNGGTRLRLEMTVTDQVVAPAEAAEWIKARPEIGPGAPGLRSGM